MPQRIKPSTKVKIVPKDGEIEITLNINITVDGKLVATATNADVIKQQTESEDEVEKLVPEFESTTQQTSGGLFGLFGRKSKG